MGTKENESMRFKNGAEVEEKTFSLDDFINELDLESLVTPIPNPEAVRKGVEIEMHIERYDETIFQK